MNVYELKEETLVVYNLEKKNDDSRRNNFKNIIRHVNLRIEMCVELYDIIKDVTKEYFIDVGNSTK